MLVSKVQSYSIKVIEIEKHIMLKSEFLENYFDSAQTSHTNNIRTAFAGFKGKHKQI